MGGGVSAPFVGSVFVGSGVNGLMGLRTLGWTSRSLRRTRYLALTGPTPTTAS